MKRLRVFVLGLCLAALAGTVGAEVELVEVADGVFAVLQEPDRRLADANNALIVTDRDVIVVDTSTDPARTREVIAAASELTALPVRYLIDTHWHLDHTQGNQAWLEAVPDIEVIGHRSLADTIPGRAVEQREAEIEAYREAIPRVEGWIRAGRDGDGNELDAARLADLRAKLGRGRAHLAMLETIRPVPPTVAVDGELVLRRGSGDVRILSLAGHTEGDLVVYLPRQEVLISGDLIDEMPFAGHGDPAVWLDSLRTLADLPIARIIPGHGPVFEGGEQLERVRGLLAGVVEEVERLAGDGSCPDDPSERVDSARFRRLMAPRDDIAERSFDAFFRSLVDRTCELRDR